MPPRRKAKAWRPARRAVLSALAVAVAVCLGLFVCLTEVDFQAVYHDASLSGAAAWYLRQEVRQWKSLSWGQSCNDSRALEARPLWASSLQLLELVAAFRRQHGQQSATKLQRVYRSMLVSRQLMLGDLSDSPAAFAALEGAGAELGFQLGDAGIFLEAQRQLGSAWHRPSPHLPACVEEMSLLLAMRADRGARSDVLETGRKPDEWLVHMLPSFDSSRELESMEHLGGHVEVARLRVPKLSGKPLVLWALPSDAQLSTITIWSHAFIFDSAGQRLAWRLSVMEEGGCLRVGVSPDKPIWQPHTLGVNIRLFWGNGSTVDEVHLPDSEATFSLYFKAGAHTTLFPKRSGCIPMHPANTPPVEELALAALFYTTQPGDEMLHIVPSISLAANKYYRVHAPDFLQRYRLPPATPGFTQSRLLASGQLHEKLWAAGFGANPTTSLAARPPAPPDWLQGGPVTPGGRLIFGGGDPQPPQDLRQTCRLARTSPAQPGADTLGISGARTPGAWGFLRGWHTAAKKARPERPPAASATNRKGDSKRAGRQGKLADWGKVQQRPAVESGCSSSRQDGSPTWRGKPQASIARMGDTCPPAAGPGLAAGTLPPAVVKPGEGSRPTLEQQPVGAGQAPAGAGGLAARAFREQQEWRAPPQQQQLVENTAGEKPSRPKDWQRQPQRLDIEVHTGLQLPIPMQPQSQDGLGSDQPLLIELGAAPQQAAVPSLPLAIRRPRYQPQMCSISCGTSIGPAHVTVPSESHVHPAADSAESLQVPATTAVASPPISPSGPQGEEAEQPECVMCLDAPRETTLAPCGHRALCLPCTLSLLGAQGLSCARQALCPMCRVGVASFIRREYLV